MFGSLFATIGEKKDAPDEVSEFVRQVEKCLDEFEGVY